MMRLTCKHVTARGEIAMRRLLGQWFPLWRRLPPARRLEAIQRIRDEASLDSTEAGADLEVVANMAEALHHACERRTQ